MVAWFHELGQSITAAGMCSRGQLFISGQIGSREREKRIGYLV
jgi:hypothetical protein